MSNTELKRSLVEIKPSQITPTEQQILNFTIIAKPGQTIEDIMEPKAWASISPRVEVWSRVNVIAEDGSYLAELHVTSVSRQWVATTLLSYHDLTEKDKDKPALEVLELHEVKWRGPILKWCLVRKEDDSNISEKMETKEQAGNAKIEYEKALRL